jgi:limonene-1,2-epoxide hydrolase
MNENEKLITRFYRALQDADIDAVRSCYAPEVVFSDPVFRSLHGERAIAMWEMFFERDEKIRVTFSDITADDTSGSGQWVADYTIGRRAVHNVIRSTFHFEDGRIVRHEDDFDVRVWAAQALGPLGALTGWARPVKAALHKRSASMLDRFVDRRGH